MRRRGVVLDRQAERRAADTPARIPVYPVIPAHAGIHCSRTAPRPAMHPGLRRDDSCLWERPTYSSGE